MKDKARLDFRQVIRINVTLLMTNSILIIINLTVCNIETSLKSSFISCNEKYVLCGQCLSIIFIVMCFQIFSAQRERRDIYKTSAILGMQRFLNNRPGKKEINICKN